MAHAAAQDTGAVARLVRDRGFGFLRSTTSGHEYFFHRSACRGVPFEELQEGTKVRFEPSMGDKGPRADTVALL